MRMGEYWRAGSIYCNPHLPFLKNILYRADWMAATGNRVNAFDILIAGIALFHHAGAIITADTDFIEIA
jgi:predicted nucleic acid-binding protein